MDEAPAFAVTIAVSTVFSALNSLTLSPALLHRNGTKSLFLFYQFLHAVKQLQDRGVFIEGVLWSHIFLTQTLRLKVLPAVVSSLMPTKPVAQSNREETFDKLTTSWVINNI